MQMITDVMRVRVAVVVAVALVAGALGCADDDYMALYSTAPKAPSLDWDAIEDLGHMGPTIIDQGVNFCVFSENATRIELALFDEPDSSQPTQQFLMEQYGDVWNLYVEGLGVGQHYGYVAWGPNWEYREDFYPYSVLGFSADADSRGNRFNPNKLMLDPYAKGYHRAHDWLAGSAASGPWRDESTYAAGSKSVIVASDYEWSAEEEDYRQRRADDGVHGWNDLIMYEVHVKGFNNNSASGVEHPGTYRGFGEKAQYLADLGITAVELLPIHMKEHSLGGYWGYSNLSYFAPEMSYSDEYLRTGEPFEVIDEFKYMVEELHKHDIEVILDVVYNHTGEGGLWQDRFCYGTDPETDCYDVRWEEVTSMFSYRGLDNSAYYYVHEDGHQFIDHTGVGGDFRASYRPGKALILDSLRWYVDELHVDGFRFDLAAVLGQDPNNPDKWDPSNAVLQEIVDDELLQQYNTRLIAEPWPWGSHSNYTGDNGHYLGDYPTSSNDPEIAFAEWNGGFRDWWRRFINDPNDEYYDLDQREYWETVNGGEAITGSAALFGDDGRGPQHSVNFITVHDGYTLYDLFSYDEPRNACSPVNPICCESPFSVWCEWQYHAPHGYGEKDWGGDNEPLKRQLMRNAYVGMMISHGTPLILGGDEWMRTQFGNTNAYSQQSDNDANWFRWGEWTNDSTYMRHRMHDFVSKLIQFRKDHADALAPDDFDAVNVDWRSPYDANASGSADWASRSVIVLYEPQSGGKVVALVNMEDFDLEFGVPPGSWALGVDTQWWYDAPGNSSETVGWFADHPDADPYESRNIDTTPDNAVSGTYEVKSRSIVVLVES
jgi:isoamylase